MKKVADVISLICSINFWQEGGTFLYFAPWTYKPKLNVSKPPYNLQPLNLVLFPVDSREAGSGDIDFEVTSNGQLVPTSRHILETNVDRFTYIPKVGKDHSIDVSFNYQSVTSK